MFDELSPEQRAEHIAYASMEPFGEVRKDMRMARLLHFYTESNRSAKSKKSKLVNFMLYSDFHEPDEEATGATEADLLNALGSGRSRGR